MDYEIQLNEIYEDEIGKLIISVDDYVNRNTSRGVSQMIGRRYGNFWERIVRYTFYASVLSSLGERVYYKDYVNAWIDDNTQDIENECCKKNAKKIILKFLEENTGTSTQDLCDFTFEYNGYKYAVDTKVRFVSNDSNTVREIANSAHHLRYMGYIPILLFRKNRDESLSSPLNRFEREGWIIKCADESSEFIKDMTDMDLDKWINDSVDVWGRLKAYHDGLKKLRFDEKEWEF